MTLKVGLTGGIGAGKSIVSRIFSSIGIPVYNADEAAKRLMQSDPNLIQSITNLFGKEAYTNGTLNRSFISKNVFENSTLLSKLNELVHPVTINDANQWFQNQNGIYAVKEAAIIFESKSYKDLDYVIGVFAPVELRIARTIERDQTARDSVLKRMEHQMNQDEIRSKCHFVIDNDDQHLIIPQVLNIHQQIINSI